MPNEYVIGVLYFHLKMKFTVYFILTQSNIYFFSVCIKRFFFLQHITDETVFDDAFETKLL